jgi:hypothetical protein
MGLEEARVLQVKRTSSPEPVVIAAKPTGTLRPRARSSPTRGRRAAVCKTAAGSLRADDLCFTKALLYGPPVSGRGWQLRARDFAWQERLGIRVGESGLGRASQIFSRLDAGELRRFDQRVEDGGDLCPAARA